VACVYDQHHELIVVDRIKHSVITCNPDLPDPMHTPVSIFAPAGRGSSRSASVAALTRSATSRSTFRRARTAFGANCKAYLPEVTPLARTLYLQLRTLYPRFCPDAEFRPDLPSAVSMNVLRVEHPGLG
jgi:hypothetical protein